MSQQTLILPRIPGVPGRTEYGLLTESAPPPGKLPVIFVTTGPCIRGYDGPP